MRIKLAAPRLSLLACAPFTSLACPAHPDDRRCIADPETRCRLPRRRSRQGRIDHTVTQILTVSSGMCASLSEEDAVEGKKEKRLKRKPSFLPFDEFRAVVDAERGTAALGFSSSSQPDASGCRPPPTSSRRGSPSTAPATCATIAAPGAGALAPPATGPLRPAEPPSPARTRASGDRSPGGRTSGRCYDPRNTPHPPA